LTQNIGGKVSTSHLPSWSITKTHESLRQRFWADSPSDGNAPAGNQSDKQNPMQAAA
jgi:hypothetical protein